MGDYLEKFYRRNMSIDEIVKRSSIVPLEPVSEPEPKYETIIVDYLDRQQIGFLWVYLIVGIFFIHEFCQFIT